MRVEVMSDTAVASVADEVKPRHRAEFVSEDFDDIPELSRQGRTSELKRRVAQVREDNTGKPRLIAKYYSSASASSAATGQRKAFAGEGYKFAVRNVGDDGQTGLFVLWKEEWVGADDAPKPRKRKTKVEMAEAAAVAAVNQPVSPETAAKVEANSEARRERNKR